MISITWHLSLSTWKKHVAVQKRKITRPNSRNILPRPFKWLSLNAYRWKSQSTTQSFEIGFKCLKKEIVAILIKDLTFNKYNLTLEFKYMEKTCCRSKEKNHSTEFEKYTPRSFQLLNLNAYRWKSQRTTQKFWNGIWMFEKVSSRFFFLFNVSQATTRKLVWKEHSQFKNKSSSSKVKSLRMSIFSTEVIEFSMGCSNVI